MEKEQLKSLVESGLSQREIAKELGKSHTAVRYWLDKYALNTAKLHKCKCGQTDPKKFHPGRYSECKTCRKRWQKDRFRKFKAKAVAYKGGKCVRCGYDKCQASMDFHHLDPNEKDPNWRKMRRWSFSRVKVELDKCVLVCRNCHGEIHYGDEMCLLLV